MTNSGLLKLCAEGQRLYDEYCVKYDDKNISDDEAMEAWDAWDAYYEHRLECLECSDCGYVGGEMKLDNVTEEDYKRLMDDYKEVEQEIAWAIEKLKPSMRARCLIISFSGGRAFYDRREEKVTKIKSSKVTNPECLEFGNDVDPIYEYFEISL